MIRDEDKDLFLSLTKLIKSDDEGQSNSRFLMWVGAMVSDSIELRLHPTNIRLGECDELIMDCVFSGVDVSFHFCKSKAVVMSIVLNNYSPTEKFIFYLEDDHKINQFRSFVLGFSNGCFVANKGA